MEILNDLAAWNAATNADREAVALEIAQNKPELSFRSIETFTCGGVTNHIATFLHEPTETIFHLLPGGEFELGSGANQSEIREKYSQDADEFYDGTVNVTPFLISQYLVTEDAWNKFDGKKLYFNLGPKNPIDGLNRGDVEAWCEKTGTRLPSEVEWEYACKAGTNTIFYWGNEPDLDYAWTNENTSFPDEYQTYTAEQQKPPNAFGLLGMIGNLGEWVADSAGAYRNPSQTPTRYPGADGILRGGWNSYDWRFNRSTSRVRCSPDSGDTGCSARVVISI